MIELNLLPEERRIKRTKLELPDIPLIPIAIGVVASIIVFQLLLGSILFLSKKRLSALDKTWKELVPKREELDKLKAKLTVVNTKTSAIQKLMTTQRNWARILNELSDSLTPDIWLKELFYEEKVEVKTVLPRKESKPVKKTKAKESLKERRKVAKIKVITATLTISGVASGKGEETTAHIGQFITALEKNKNFSKDFDNIEFKSSKKASIMKH